MSNEMETQVDSVIEAPLAIDGGPKARTVPGSPRLLFGQEEKQAVMELMDQAMVQGHGILGYNGPQEEGYCKEFAEFMGGGYADGVNSGTNSVYVALRALEPEAFSEVIVPAVSDPGGVMPVALCNCIPVAADCAPGSFNIGAEQIAAKITDRTSAIIVAHIAGLPADMDPIMELARSKGIPVIEDCSQSHGAVYKGRKVGSIGDIGAFSTMFGKHHATGGQGGMVFTTSEDLYWKVRRYADRGKPFGIENNVGGNVVGALNCNMDELHAAIGRQQIKKLPAMIKNRQQVAKIVADGCRQHMQAVTMHDAADGCEGVYWFLILQLTLDKLSVSKERFAEALKEEGFSVSVTYRHVPVQMNWYVNQRVFGKESTMPWSANGHEFAAHQTFEVPNVDATDACCFTISIHECVTAEEAEEMVLALRKVERAYLK